MPAHLIPNNFARSFKLVLHALGSLVQINLESHQSNGLGTMGLQMFAEKPLRPRRAALLLLRND